MVVLRDLVCRTPTIGCPNTTLKRLRPAVPKVLFLNNPALTLTSLGGFAVVDPSSIDVALPNSTALWRMELASQNLGLTRSNVAGIATSNRQHRPVGGR